MQEEKRRFDKIAKVYFDSISRQLFIFGIGLLFIQFLSFPVLALSVDYKEGYNVITYDDGSKDIISGALNFLRWDGAWRPNEEMNISNGSWPYLYSENTITADFKVDDTTLSIPKTNTEFNLKPYSVSYDLTFAKSELQGKETSINLTSAFIDLPYDLKSRKPKNKYKDKHNIKFGRLHFKAGMEDIAIHDDTLRDYIEDGKIIQDVTYLFPGDYEFGVDNNGEIRLEFKKEALNKLNGNITIEIRTWDIIGPNNWGGNVTFSQATDVKATGNVELKQKVTDWALYTRFDEGSGTTIHNENILNQPFGSLKGTVGSGTWTAGKYGQAIHFDGVKNKVLFNDHPDFRLTHDFTISYYIRLTYDVNNQDTDITRKGSTATAPNKEWWKVEIKSNKMQGVVFNDEPSEIAEKDTTDRRNGNWYFVAYTRGGNTCSLIVDGSTVASRTNCATNIGNSAQLAIGAKDTETSGTGMDYTHGTIDEVRFFNRKLSSTELTSIRNNEHFTTGTVTRSLVSIIQAGEELKELGCNGTWDGSITKVDIMASTNNITWDTIQSNAIKNVPYNVSQNNNYKYTRCSLSTTNASRTPIIESIRARISSSTISPQLTIPPQPRNLQYTSGNYWVNHTWQAGTGVVTDAYNISVNGVWHNRTNSYYNDFAGASNWSDIIVWAWNRTGSGNMSALSVGQNIQAPSIPLRINITSFAPLSPVYDNVGAARTFNLTVNETVDMTWYINGTQVSSNSSVTAGNYTNASSKSGTWNVSVVVNNSNGSVGNTWIWTVSDLIASAGGPYTGTPGVLINFTGSASGGPAPYSYNWSFGDGGTSSLVNPAHTYSNTGTYSASLIVTDSAVRTSSPDTASVSVEWVRFINGTVKDSVNKSGLAGVKVFTNTSLSTVTDAAGFYSFEVVSGDYNITATIEPIYYPNSTDVSLFGAVVVQDIELIKKSTGNITGYVNS